MNFDITSKLELNLSDPMIPIPFATELASKHKMAAIVVYDPLLVRALIQQRFSSNARWKIVLALDFPQGARYVLEKFKQLPQDFDMTHFDGFDILLSSKTYNNAVPNDIEVRNEVQILRDFVHRYNRQTEVRYCIDILTRPSALIDSALKAFKTISPAFIRLDHNLEMPVGRANLETITKAIDVVRKHTSAPIKCGTNTTLELIKALPMVSRFDVNVKQAQQIIHDLNAPPVEVKTEIKAETPPAAPAQA